MHGSSRLVHLLTFLAALVAVVATSRLARAAATVPTDVQMPGTQPSQVLAMDSSQCGLCHGGFNRAIEPYFTWRGSMMSHAGEDPLFWATVAVAERDFDGAGDLCLRCHSSGAWVGGRSTPTDGSRVTATDAWYGVQCAACHRMANPDGSENRGIQNAPFLTQAGGETFRGAGQYVLGYDDTRFGPYKDAAPPHLVKASAFHRSSDMCGTCHDVSNPIVGDLAPGHGAQIPLPAGKFSGVLGAAVTEKAAFKNAPYKYGIVERTYSEHVASAFPTLRVSAFEGLPAELKAGSIKVARDAARASTSTGDYVDGTPRTFTCQTCHMQPASGAGAWTGAPTRRDLPVHDLTGANTWVPKAIQYMAGKGSLRTQQLYDGDADALNAGIKRAEAMLKSAASLTIAGDSVRVVNLTGHKLISGYPEGRRMWLRVRFRDGAGTLVREDGAYGRMTVTLAGRTLDVESLLDLKSPRLHAYDIHGGVTQAWAAKLLSLGYNGDHPISFDRMTGAPTATLQSTAAQAPGTAAKSLHFALDDTILADTRIPPYRMGRSVARDRNALPVPANQFGDPADDGVYNHWDDVALDPPASATTADIELLYQTTSWEYVQFLYLANDGRSASLKGTGEALLDAWLNTGMSAPVVMASARWVRAGAAVTSPPATSADAGSVAVEAGEAPGTTTGSVATGGASGATVQAGAPGTPAVVVSPGSVPSAPGALSPTDAAETMVVMRDVSAAGCSCDMGPGRKTPLAPAALACAVALGSLVRRRRR